MTSMTLGRKDLMDYAQLPAIIAAVTALVVAFGGGVKWMLSRMDNQDAAEREWQRVEREKLEKQFLARIATMEAHVQAQEAEIARMRDELTRYVRHVGVLEGLLRANGIEAPPIAKIT